MISFTPFLSADFTTASSLCNPLAPVLICDPEKIIAGTTRLRAFGSRVEAPDARDLEPGLGDAPLQGRRRHRSSKLIQYELVPAKYLVTPSIENLVPLTVDFAVAVGRTPARGMSRPKVMPTIAKKGKTDHWWKSRGKKCSQQPEHCSK